MAHDYDTGKRLYCSVAYGSPYRGYRAEYASEQLLTRVWLDESDEGSLIQNVFVKKAGLLTGKDVQRLVLAVFGE